MNSKKGKIYFVGAGPGDPELITVKGLKALQQAEVIIYDRLVHPSLLLEAKKDAKLIYCGKQPCKHTLRQSDIQKELIIQAKKGKSVVRLKGGDPAVFGRVGEEAEAVKKQHIPYEMISGVTAGSAAAMYTGVPLTHRDHSRSFAIVTGHSKDTDGKPDIAWGDLAKGVDTIVFYMGIKNLSHISEQLIEQGKNRFTRTLVTEWGTYGRQRSITGSLEDIPRLSKENNMSNPAVIVVGDVTKLHDSIQWIKEKPLTGKGIIMMETDQRDRDTAASLKEEGAEVYSLDRISTIEIEVITRLMTEGHANSVVIQKEQNAKALMKMFVEARNRMEGKLPRLFYICVGKQAANVLRRHGYKADAVLPVLSHTDAVIGALSEKVLLDSV